MKPRQFNLAGLFWLIAAIGLLCGWARWLGVYAFLTEHWESFCKGLLWTFTEAETRKPDASTVAIIFGIVSRIIFAALLFFMSISGIYCAWDSMWNREHDEQ